jgi:hypothetical protein
VAHFSTPQNWLAQIAKPVRFCSAGALPRPAGFPPKLECGSKKEHFVSCKILQSPLVSVMPELIKAGVYAKQKPDGSQCSDCHDLTGRQL